MTLDDSNKNVDNDDFVDATLNNVEIVATHGNVEDSTFSAELPLGDEAEDFDSSNSNQRTSFSFFLGSIVNMRNGIVLATTLGVLFVFVSASAFGATAAVNKNIAGSFNIVPPSVRKSSKSPKSTKSPKSGSIAGCDRSDYYNFACLSDADCNTGNCPGYCADTVGQGACFNVCYGGTCKCD